MGGRRKRSVDEILARSSPDVARVAGALRAQLQGMIDGVMEEADVPRGRIRFRRRGLFAFLQPMSDHIRLGFDHGDVLPDLGGLLAGDRGHVRHLELRTAAHAASREVKLLLSAALFDDDTHGFRRRRGR